MARPPKSRIKDEADFLSTLSDKLRNAARRPNVFGYRPHEKQEMFHISPARGKQFIGGNRSGKTVGGGVETVNRLRGEDPFKPVKRPGPVTGRAVGVDFDHGVSKIMMPEVARWLPPSLLINGSWEDSYDKQLKTLTLTNKSTLEFMSYEQDLEKFAGTSRDFVWFDEEPPEDIFNECLMRLIDVAGDWWMTMTPVEGMTWTYDTIYVAARTNPNLFVVEVETDENPFINSGEIDILQVGLDEAEKQARRKGQYVQREGLIYPFINEAHFVETIMPPLHWLHFAMMDHGVSNPTCFLWGAVNPDGLMVIYDEHYRGRMIVAEHAVEVHRKNLEHGRVPDYYVGDPNIKATEAIAGTSIQLEYIEHGIPILLGNNEVKAGISLVSARLIGVGGRPQLFICKDSCPNLTFEIQRYRWASWANRAQDRNKNAKEEPHKKNDHACDALRYGVASRPQMGYDTGTEIPEYSDMPTSSKAVSPYNGQVDEHLASKPREYVDSVLGAEY